jgi:hypothetical protein
MGSNSLYIWSDENFTNFTIMYLIGGGGLWTHPIQLQFRGKVGGKAPRRIVFGLLFQNNGCTGWEGFWDPDPIGKCTGSRGVRPGQLACQAPFVISKFN